MSQPMIRIEGLAKSFGATQALRGLSFEVPRGQIVGFLGPNGAGKSTTMRILAGFVQPSAGKASVDGIDVVAEPVAARRKVGYLPENNPLYEDMMVLEFLSFMAAARSVPKDQQASRIRHVVERCGLSTVLGKDISELSKGFRQRVGLAQAILHDPALLILDEPTSGLDPNQIIEIRGLIKELGREKTVVLSTHILPEVQNTCQRVLIINDGRLVADDAPERLTAQRGGATVTVTVASRQGGPLDGAKVRSLLAAVPGVTAVEPGTAESTEALAFTLRCGEVDVRRALFEVAVKNDLVLLELRRVQLSLEETFRQLTAA